MSEPHAIPDFAEPPAAQRALDGATGFAAGNGEGHAGGASARDAGGRADGFGAGEAEWPTSQAGAGRAGRPSERLADYSAEDGKKPAPQQILDIYAAQATKQKDHVSAGLLAIFLGMFGMHKFYLGYNQSGFVMLAAAIVVGILTFGLASAVIWVIAIVEGIVYLSKTQEEFDRIYVTGKREWF